ncbi:cell division ATP-binding protein FtsE [Litoribrevibacter albus]|uniref:Cell division ATP-binding protein FtsE n=1 Tax=Litoribrevibacter albus TaxID=1473156 RepID=A0AA37S8A6_9GAMM|nr:cell division ATP-binding protein FtsE [Litoribrevibacter albus]GLQ30546.1 cell division ATP-binding protein FtsE [Litoribrevibacter albus]
MIKFEQVTKRYETGQEALSNVSFHIERGQMVFLTGHSGAGKSTLLKLIMRMETPTSGRVQIAGQNLTQLDRKDIPFYRRHIGVVFQNHQLLFDRSVYENVALPMRISGHSEHDIGKRVRAALDKVGLLHKEKVSPVALSTGEQQRVGIARAVVNKPALLLADEPTGNLDPELSQEIMTLFKDFQRVGVTVLIASHDHELIQSMALPVMTLAEGQLVNFS